LDYYFHGPPIGGNGLLNNNPVCVHVWHRPQRGGPAFYFAFYFLPCATGPAGGRGTHVSCVAPVFAQRRELVFATPRRDEVSTETSVVGHKRSPVPFRDR
jgi:hypothetical protein